MSVDRDEPADINHRIPSRTFDLSARINRLRRKAEEYRTLADAAKTDVAHESYVALAADYDDLADRAEETRAPVTRLRARC
jgi:hypothetical protein